MMIYKTPNLQIYFGSATDGISKKDHCVPTAIPLVNHSKFKPVAERLEVQHLAFLNQTHSIDGLIIEREIPAFNKDGDYLITAQKNIGIGVMTADCLPIVFYDTKNHVAAVVHAGWRGSVAGIAAQALHAMQKNFHSAINDLQIFFGPSAKPCCYEVSKEFINNLNGHKERVTHSKDGKYYFDVPEFNKIQLQESGVPSVAINTDYNACTICDHRFFSSRRQDIGRQMTIISLY